MLPLLRFLLPSHVFEKVKELPVSCSGIPFFLHLCIETLISSSIDVRSSNQQLICASDHITIRKISTVDSDKPDFAIHQSRFVVHLVIDQSQFCNHLQLGGIEEGEEPTSAVVRELREETGVVSAKIISEVPKWLTYDFPPAVKAKVNRLWGGGEWHGQAQKWFLMRLTKDESEINLASGEVDPEFSEWKWASPEEVIERANMMYEKTWVLTKFGYL
ncbi:hypothetical protein L2E82_44622 [Cichorium intybus]|uniref:Uncharacterized protein n=1 Tax=Cichorium intybus TaxID=13427 RepID=A0ACB8ZQM5_CICIN|nr:hypothetical protein L2E82_44622 [Cichorium intybus]